MKPELFIHWKAKERSYIVGRTGRRVSPLPGVVGLATWRPVWVRPVAAERDWALPKRRQRPPKAGRSFTAISSCSVCF